MGGGSDTWSAPRTSETFCCGAEPIPPSTRRKPWACGCTNLFVSGKTDPCVSPPPQHPHSKRQATDSTDSSDSYHLRSHMGSPACVPRFTSSSSIIQRLGRTRTHKQQQLPPPPPSRAPPITPNIVCALDSERPPRPVNAELQLILVAWWKVMLRRCQCVW